jgi:hypothetical protein
MRKIRAYSCTREGRAQSSGKAVCFLLDTAHAGHTLRAFLRDRGEGAVLQPMADAEARRLLETAASADAAGDKSSA